MPGKVSLHRLTHPVQNGHSRRVFVLGYISTVCCSGTTVTLSQLDLFVFTVSSSRIQKTCRGPLHTQGDFPPVRGRFPASSRIARAHRKLDVCRAGNTSAIGLVAGKRIWREETLRGALCTTCKGILRLHQKNSRLSHTAGGLGILSFNANQYPNHTGHGGVRNGARHDCAKRSSRHFRCDHNFHRKMHLRARISHFLLLGQPSRVWFGRSLQQNRTFTLLLLS